jgi:hypothetical protein
MADIDAILNAAQRPELNVDIYLGPVEFVDKYLELQEANRVDEAAAVEEKMLDYTLGTRVRAMPHVDWEKLKLKHPPREDVKADRGKEVNMSTFFPEAVPPCLVDLTPDQYERLYGVISDGEWGKLTANVWAVNTRFTSLPFLRAGLPISQVSVGS